MNMEEFASRFYGPTATQSFNGGSNELIGPYKLSKETLGREIGSSFSLEGKQINGGDSVSFEEKLKKALGELNLNGGKGKTVTKRSGGDSEYYPVKELEYAHLGTKYEQDVNDWMDITMSRYLVTHAPSSAIVVVPPKSTIAKLKTEIEKELKKMKGGKFSDKHSEILHKSKYETLRNAFFYVYVSNENDVSSNYEYRIDPAQTGGKDAWPNSDIFVSGRTFRRANFCSYIWFFIYNTEKKAWFMYPTADFKKDEGIELEFIGYARSGKYMFMAKKDIPDNINNKLEVGKMNTKSVFSISLSGGDLNMNPLPTLIRNWRNHGLELGSEITLRQMAGTNREAVEANLSANLVHSAILCALDGIKPGEFSDLSKPSPVQINGGNLRVDVKDTIGDFFKSVASQYPSGTKSNIIKADIIYSLIRSGYNPELAMDALNLPNSKNKQLIKIMKDCLDKNKFEYFTAKAIPIAFIEATNEDGIKKIFEDKKEPEEQKVEGGESEEKEEKEKEKEEPSISSSDDEDEEQLDELSDHEDEQVQEVSDHEEGQVQEGGKKSEVFQFKSFY